jgi:hypothetical protein
VLAGGIAHDFNNLLGSIHANAELADVSMTEGSLPREEIQTIRAISMRASGIVTQLMLYAGNKDPVTSKYWAGPLGPGSRPGIRSPRIR